MYEKIELIKSQNHEALIEDIQERTGINVTRIEEGKVDFLRDTANVTIFYYEDNQPNK